MSENGVNLPNEIAIKSRDNDQQNHWVNGVHYFQTNPLRYIMVGVCVVHGFFSNQQVVASSWEAPPGGEIVQTPFLIDTVTICFEDGNEAVNMN